MGRKSRDKGSRAEREVCKLLSDWWNAKNVTFERSPLSGGWSKGSGKKFGTGADIVCSDPSFPFSVEVKYREKWDLDNLLRGRKSPVWKWINQCADQANEAKKLPLLFFRKNRYPWMVATFECILPIGTALAKINPIITEDSYAITSAARLFELDPSLFIGK